MFGSKDQTATKAPPSSSTTPDKEIVSLDSSLLHGVNVQLEAYVGTSDMTLEALLALRSGDVVTLDAQLNDLVELRLNDAVVGRGELVAVGDNFGIRIVEITSAS